MNDPWMSWVYALVPLLDPVLSAITMLHIFRARDFSLGSRRVERNCLLALQNRPRGTRLDKSSPLDKTRTGHLVRQSKHLPGVRGTEENINVCPAVQAAKHCETILVIHNVWDDYYENTPLLESTIYNIFFYLRNVFNSVEIL